jgi:hypothetical protein
MPRRYIYEIPSRRSLNNLGNGPSDRLRPEFHYECPMNLLLRSRVIIGIMACIVVIVTLILFFAESPNTAPADPENFYQIFFFIVSQPAKKKLSDG